MGTPANKSNTHKEIYMSTVSEPSDMKQNHSGKPVSCSNDCAATESYKTTAKSSQVFTFFEEFTLSHAHTVGLV